MLEVVSYQPDYAQVFYDINKEWVSSMFEMEEIDEIVLSNPQSRIIDKGGEILFVLDKDKNPIGTAALMPDGDGGIELTKMGVFKSARGLGAGKVILKAAIKKGLEMKPEKKLYLLTNKSCEAAIHLYLENGFVHSPEILSKKGFLYERSNVAMEHVGL